MSLAFSVLSGSSLRDCSHAYRSSVICRKRYDLKNIKQVLRRPTDACSTLTYDRAGFTYKSLRNHVQNICIFLRGGMSMAAYVTAAVKACFAALRQIRSIRHSLSREALLTLIRALIVSKLDYTVAQC